MAHTEFGSECIRSGLEIRELLQLASDVSSRHIPKETCILAVPGRSTNIRRLRDLTFGSTARPAAKDGVQTWDSIKMEVFPHAGP